MHLVYNKIRIIINFHHYSAIPYEHAILNKVIHKNVAYSWVAGTYFQKCFLYYWAAGPLHILTPNEIEPSLTKTKVWILQILTTESLMSKKLPPGNHQHLLP